MRHLYVQTREGLAFAGIPADVVAALESTARDEAELEKALETAGLIVVRVGREGGEALLRHVTAHDPRILVDADPRFKETLAREPELIVGSLAGT